MGVQEEVVVVVGGAYLPQVEGVVGVVEGVELSRTPVQVDPAGPEGWQETQTVVHYTHTHTHTHMDEHVHTTQHTYAYTHTHTHTYTTHLYAHI